MDELSTLKHLINDRVIALAQHALDAGMKYAVLDPHHHDGAIHVITASYSVANGIAGASSPGRMLVTSLTSIIAIGVARRDREEPRHADGLHSAWVAPGNGALGNIES